MPAPSSPRELKVTSIIVARAIGGAIDDCGISANPWGAGTSARVFVELVLCRIGFSRQDIETALDNESARRAMAANHAAAQERARQKAAELPARDDGTKTLATATPQGVTQ